ncbi:MAG: DUF4062 domain-containing protein [Acidobacteria bacterium]|nr:DUF4062 domain-containing protein [Acidobacteriota bacterium]
MPTSPRPGQKTAMISSTSLDLPEHRKQVVEACLRESVFPIGMEQLPVRDSSAITVDREMVDNADIYIGIFGVRYGEIPPGYDVSYTELEFKRADDRGIPILVFVMHKDHPVTFEMVEADAEAQRKLADLKKRASAGRIRGEFKSPEELRGLVIQALADLRRREEDEKGKPASSFHPHYDIPEPPEPFIAHPYTLLQTRGLIGRQAELNLLTDWVAKPNAEIYAARIVNIVALGGVGKSALTWHWFNEIAPHEMKPMAGRLWWSFYESDARFENFIARALAYVTRRPMAEIEAIPLSDRESQLLTRLDREPFLIVLDGMERLLIAYARMDAAYLDGPGTHASQRAVSAEETSLPEAAQVDAHPSLAKPARWEAGVPRKTADPRVGNFLRKLAGVKASRILVSTRLHPADLENKVNGDPLPGCYRRDLAGLSDDDALELWRKFNVSGARDQLLPIFNRVENHPLLIQALAGEVARFRRAPGNFEAWKKAHPDFNPFQDLPLVQVKSYVLDFAMRGLAAPARQVLWTIAAFRMPASYDSLVALLVAKARRSKSKPVVGEQTLDTILVELEDRGLVGWDMRVNRYDLHPIVRGVVWNSLADDARHDVYINLHKYFEAAPVIDYWQEVNSLEDLTPAIELYHTLIGLGHHDDAFAVFRDRLSDAMSYRLSASRQQIELLEHLFPSGVEQLPHLRYPEQQAYTLNSLALSYHYTGQPGLAAQLSRRANQIYSDIKNDFSFSIGLRTLSYALSLSGKFRDAEAAARQSLSYTRVQTNALVDEARSLNWIGLAMAARGETALSNTALTRALKLLPAEGASQWRGYVSAKLSQLFLWKGDLFGASTFAKRAYELSQDPFIYEPGFIQATRLTGEIALGIGDFVTADERLHHALTHARQVNFTEEELPALIALAELRRRQNQPAEARELLDDVWEAAERGPYPLFHADALNVLAALERDAGNKAKAIEAATQAYRLAWCDGPPFAYHWGLEAVRKNLRELGVPEPEMPPFDPSKFEPMPEVELNPKDKFYVEIDEE